ncbi:hypothetical protein, partial [Actinomadura sp. NPDC000929]|uniref:hypothetical protein n=1 Tax=Actinomadura sp. NPDC000929 TaxID=3154517 RepID=UPI0033938C3D
MRTLARAEDRWHRRGAAFVWRSGVALPVALAHVPAPPAGAAVLTWPSLALLACLVLITMLAV